MATPQKPKFNVSPDNDDVPDIPDEIQADEEQPIGLTADQLNEQGFNDEQDEAEVRKLNPPTGDWFKEDTFEYVKRVNTEDQMTGDIDHSGRTLMTFTGRPEPRTANGIDYQPMFFIRISPDRRYKQDKPQEVDLAYKLFLKAKELYLALYAEKPRNLGQLKDMLCEASYVVRSMNGDNGAIAVDIKPKRQQR